jgi:hypothetical protein
MIYNININQKELTNSTMDLVDSAILNYLIIVCNSKNENIAEQRIWDNENIYTPIDFNKIIKNNPLLRIKSKGAITPRLKRIEKNGYILIKNVKKKTFVALTSKIDSLFVSVNEWNGQVVHENEQVVHENEQVVHENEQVVHENEQLSSKKLKNNNIYNNNNNNIYNNNIIKKEKENNIKEKEKEKGDRLLNLFYKEINPNIRFENATFRRDSQWLQKNYDWEKLEAMVWYIKKNQNEPYFPVITNPTHLREKMAQLINFKNRKNKKHSNNIIKI